MAELHPGQPTRSLIEAFSEIARHIHSSQDYDDSLRRLTHTALLIRNCDAASLSIIERGQPVTRAATDRLASDGDKIQYEEGEGPCLDVAMADRWVYSPDLANEARWPRSSARIARELQVRSLMSCRLALDAAPNQTLGGINLYSRTACAFSEQDQMLVILLSSLGAVVVDASREQSHLRAAIESRQVIGEAIGILRAQSGLTSDEAFAALSRASQRMNVKLRDLARRIAEGDPTGHTHDIPPVGTE